MGHSRGGVLASLLAVACGAGFFGARSGEKASNALGSVVGRVIDLEGRPVAGAEVWAGDRDQVAARARTDADGRFRLESVSDERAATVWAEDEERGLAREHFEDVPRLRRAGDRPRRCRAGTRRPPRRAASLTWRGGPSRGPRRRS